MKKSLIAFICGCFFTGYAQVNLNTNLEACYSLNGNANDPVNSLNGTLGTVTTASDRNSVANNCYEFNGSMASIISLPDNPKLKGQSMTVSAWVYAYNTNPAYIVFAKNNFGAFHEGYALSIDGTNLLANKVNSSGMYYQPSLAPVSANTWYHLVMTVDQNTLSFYVNGVLQGSISAPGALDYETGKGVQLGGSNESYFPAPFNGRIDNVRFYSRVINAAEVTALYTTDPACGACTSATFTPKYYFQFESSQYYPTCQTATTPGCDPWNGGYPRYKDVIRNQIQRSYYGTSYPSPGQVGDANTERVQTTGVGAGLTLLNINSIPGGDLTLTNGFSAEFIMKPDVTKGNNWQLYFNFRGLLSPYINIDQGNFNFRIVDNATNAQIQLDKSFIPNYPGMFSNDYFNDGNWHHLAFVYDGANNKMQIWIDAILLPGFEKIIPANTQIKFPDTYYSNYTRGFNGQWDEFAVYDKALPPELIFQHYKDMQSGNHYSYCTSYTSANVPTPPVPVCNQLPSNEYSPATVNTDEQLFSFPLPRYIPGHQLKPNFPWADIQYLSRFPSTGNLFPNPSQSALLNINQERARKWNYYLEAPAANTNMIALNSPPGLGNAWKTQLNNLNSFPLSTILYESYGSNVSLTPISTATTAALPGGSMENRGKTVASTLNNNLVQHLSRSLDIINLDEESFNAYGLLPPGNQSTTGPLQRDLDLRFQNGLLDRLPNATASGPFGNNFNYIKNTNFTKYRVGYYDDYQYAWTKDATAWGYATLDVYTSPTHWNDGNPASHGLTTFEISRNIEMATAGAPQLCSPFVSANYSSDESSNMKPSQYLAALKEYGMMGADFYYVGYFNEARPAKQTPTPVINCSSIPTPTVATYAWPNAANPVFCGSTLYVTHPGGPNDPRKYFYQIAMPSYAQAITSRYEDILKSSFLLSGLNSLYPTNIKHRFTMGNEVVYARKYYEKKGPTILPQELYVINGSIMINNNCAGFEPEEKKQCINLTGWNGPAADNITFNIRRQGSTYIYDRRDPNNIIFFQLDKWHEVTHPYYWSKDFRFEAEVFDDMPYTSNVNIKLKTSRPSTASADDYSNFTTYVQYPPSATKSTIYQFEPRDQMNTEKNVTYYVWVRARRNMDASTPPGYSSIDLKIKRENNTNPNTINPPINTTVLNKTTIPCIDNSGFKWYNFTYIPNNNNAVAISFTGVTTHLHEIEFTGGDKYVEFDQFIITDSPNPPAGVAVADIVSMCPVNPNKMAMSQPEESQSDATFVYPSPNEGNFVAGISSREGQITEIIITDMQGKTVYHRNQLSGSQVEINLPAEIGNGLYFVQIRVGTKIYNNKIVVSK